LPLPFPGNQHGKHNFSLSWLAFIDLTSFSYLLKSMLGISSFFPILVSAHFSARRVGHLCLPFLSLVSLPDADRFCLSLFLLAFLVSLRSSLLFLFYFRDIQHTTPGCSF